MDYANTAAFQHSIGRVGGINSGVLNTLEPQAETGPFVTAGIAFQQVYELCRRVRELSDRTLGPVPTPVSDMGKMAATPPTFVALQGAAEAALSEIASATEALNRIERVLP